MSTEIDYDAIEETPIKISDETLESIAELAQRQIKVEDWIVGQLARLKVAQENLQKLSRDLIPEAMKSAGLQEFTLANGCVIKVNTSVKAKIPEHSKELAFTWLREHDHGDLIRNEFTVSFGVGEDDQAKELATYLLDGSQAFKQKEYVHHQTLPAFVRQELLAHDHDETWEKMFGVFRLTETTITRSKEQK